MSSADPVIINETAYEAAARAQLEDWRRSLLTAPSWFDRTARGVQVRINRAIPEKVHAVVTATIEGMTRAIVTGADLTTDRRLIGAP